MQHRTNETSDPLRRNSFGPWHREFSNTFSTPVEGDNWFDEVRRRFDERRKRWDEDVRRMRQDFFTIGSERIKRSFTPPRLYMPRSSYHFSKPFSGQVESNADGCSYFTAKFDLTGFSPDEIRVSVRENEVFVSAKTEEVTEQGRSIREYSRAVKLPDGANDALADATLTPEGILTFTCPMRSSSSERYDSLERSDLQEAFSPSSTTSTTSKRSSAYWRKRNPSCEFTRHSPSSLTSSRAKFCLQLPIGMDYSPAEVNIRTVNRRIYVTAKHEEHRSNRTAIREFSKEYDIPEGINPECLEARMENGILYIEAV